MSDQAQLQNNQAQNNQAQNPQGAAAQASDGQGAADPNAAAVNAAAPANDGAAGEPQIYRPEGIAEHMVGKTDQETIDMLLSAYSGARKELGKGKTIPDSADGYKVEIPDEMKGTVFNLDDKGNDPILEKFKPIAHKHNISAEAFQEIAVEFGQALSEFAGASDDSVDFGFEQYGGEENVKPLIDGIDVWAKGLRNRDHLNDQDIEELKLLTSHSQGVQLLSKLRVLTGEQPIPVNTENPAGGDAITEDMLNQRIADERYKSGSPKFDKSFYDETTRMFQQFYNKT